MQRNKLKTIEELKVMLINNGHTEHAPLQLSHNVTLYFNLNQFGFGNIIGMIEVKYLYIKGGTIFVADSKYDEIDVYCIESQSIHTLLSTLTKGS